MNLCSLVLQINKTDKNRLWVERAAIGTGIVTGIALSMTGIGSPLGVGLLATMGAATGVEVHNLNQQIKDSQNEIHGKTRSASTYQINLNQAIKDIEAQNESIKDNERSKKLAIILAGLDAMGSGGLRLVKNFFKTQKGIKAGALLGLTSHQLSMNKAYRVSKEIATGIEQMASKLGSKSMKIVNELQHEEIMELGVLFNKLPADEKSKLTKLMKEFESSKDFRNFLDLTDLHQADILLKSGKLNTQKLIELAEFTKAKKLPDGTLIDNLIADNEIALARFEDSKTVSTIEPIKIKTKPTADITLQNNGLITKNAFHEKLAQKFTNKLDKSPRAKAFYEKLTLSEGEMSQLKTNLSHLSNDSQKKMLTILSDDAKTLEKFQGDLKASGCLNQLYTQKCRVKIEKIISNNSKTLKEHKVFNDWVGKQPNEMQRLIQESGMTPADLANLDKSLLEGVEIKNFEQARRYIEKIRHLPIEKQPKLYDELHLVLSGKPVKDSKITYNIFKAEDKLFDTYEKIYVESKNLFKKKELKEVAKERGMKPTKENLKILKEEKAAQLRKRQQTRFNACKNGSNAGGRSANIKKFIKYNMSANLVFTVSSYMWFMGSDDDKKIEIDMTGDLITGEPDREFSELISVLGYELVASYVFSQIPKAVMSSAGDSLLTRSVKDYSMGSSLDFINTRIFGTVFGKKQSESEAMIRKLLLDPEKKKYMVKLEKYMERKLATPRVQKTLQQMKLEFGKFEENQSSYMDYEALTDNFTSEQLYANEEIRKVFEDAYNERIIGPKASLSRDLNIATGGLVENSVENDLFYYNLGYNAVNAPRRIALYSFMSNRICMGHWGEVLTITAVDKFLSNAAYWAGRKYYVGK